MKNILNNLKSLLVVSSVMLTIFAVLNFFFMYKLSNNIDTISEQTLEASDMYHNLRKELKNEQDRISFMSNVMEIKNVLDSFASKTKSYNTMDFAYLIAKESYRNNLDPLLVLAVIKTESSFRKSVVSHKGAIGLMQVLPNTAHYISGKVEHIDLESRSELFQPDTNIVVGINYLAYLINKFDSEKYAIIAYNMGPTNLLRKIRSGKSLPDRYYRNVMKSYSELSIMSGRV